ncbi:WD repeat domain-containing protein 83-like [Dermatophagoides pteronyssinus]|uniref:WD repeat domain-containing protein 83-like n=1 Tax=Dermatophagoides pteronyssinus TaxID=6956 RepID=UPI003F66DE0C
MNLTCQIEHSFDCHQGAIRKVTLNVDGEYCLTCGSDKTIKLWNPRKQLLLKTYSGHGFEVMDVDCSCDSSQLISGSHDKTLILWDVTTGQPLRRLRAHIAVVNVVRFNEDSTVFVSGSLDGMVKIWDGKSNSREPIQVLDEAKDSISYLAITDHEIATVSLDHHLRRYDIRKGIMEADNLHSPLTYVNFTNDSQCMLVSGMNNLLKLVDKSSGQILASFEGHLNQKYRIDNGFLDNDSLIISGSEDGNIYIWSLLEGTIVAKLPHKQKVIHTFAIHPTKMELISGAENKVHIWQITKKTN